MMNKNLFSEGIGHIDTDAVERLLRIENELEKKRARRKHAWLKPVLIAAALALLLCAVLVIVPFIPRDLHLDYQMLPEGSDVAYDRGNAWIYYTSKDGEIEREYVSLPLSAQNVFLSWKHLNGLDDTVQMLDCKLEADQIVNAQPVPQTLWEHLSQAFSQNAKQKTMTVTLSAQITSQPNYKALIESLQKTLAKYAGLSPEQVRILIDGESVLPTPVPTPIVSGQLEFSYTANGSIFMPGQTIEITATMTNVSDTDVEYTGSLLAFYPDVTLIATAHDEVYWLMYQDRMITNEIARYTLSPGDSRTTTYVFPIPDNALLGSYQLQLYFGAAAADFGIVLTIVNTDLDIEVDPYENIAPAFAEFLNEYGFVVPDHEYFRQSVSKLTYQTQPMFDIMFPAEVSWIEGAGGQVYSSAFFDYEYSYYLPADETKEEYYSQFSALDVLPDDMILPYEITSEDTFESAIQKLGINQQDAKALATGELIIGTPTCSVTIQKDGNYNAIVFTEISASPDKDYNMEEGLMRSLSLRFDKSGQGFMQLAVTTSQRSNQINSFAGPVSIVRHDGCDVDWRLNEEQTVWLLYWLNYGQWWEGKPMEKDWDKETCIRVGETLLYYAEDYWVMDGQYMQIDKERKAILSGILDDFPFFHTSSEIAVNSPYDGIEHYAPLRESERDQILAILNGGDWERILPDMLLQPHEEFACTVTYNAEVYELYYNAEAGIFLYDDHYLRISGADMNTVGEIFGGYTIEMPHE